MGGKARTKILHIIRNPPDRSSYNSSMQYPRHIATIAISFAIAARAAAAAA